MPQGDRASQRIEVFEHSTDSKATPRIRIKRAQCWRRGQLQARVQALRVPLGPPQSTNWTARLCCGLHRVRVVAP